MTTKPSESTFPYAVLLRRDGGIYRLSVPTLDVECEGEDLAAAFRDIEMAAEARLAESRLMGEEPPVEAPPWEHDAHANSGASRWFNSETMRVLIGLSAIAAFLAGAFALVAVASALSGIGAIVGDVGRLTGGAAAMFDEAAGLTLNPGVNLARAARKVEQVTPERKEQLRRDLSIIVENLRPLADEIRPLFTGEPGPSVPVSPNNPP